MSRSKEELADMVLRILMDINNNTCSITEEDIITEDDELVRDILGGLLTLNEDLQYRELEREKAVNNLHQLNDELEQRVREQSQAILELSTPVLQIWDDIIILPLIGAVDTVRASQVLEHALDAARKWQATIFLLDVTGVPVIDTAVAKHLLQTIDALKLLGTETILTGVSPVNAQTIVALGIELKKIRTRGTLQMGLQLAMEMIALSS